MGESDKELVKFGSDYLICWGIIFWSSALVSGHSVHHIDQLLDFERFTPGRIVEERDRFLVAVAGTDTASHAGGLVDNRIPIIYRDGRELAVFAAVTAADTQFLVH